MQDSVLLGYYGRKRILPKGYPHSGLWLASHTPMDTGSCGEAILSKLTGRPPSDISWRNNFKRGMSESFMIRELKKAGFHILCLTDKVKERLLKARDTITQHHLVLINARLTSKDNSWLLYYNNVLYHNDEALSAAYITALQFPINKAWVIYHPDLAASINQVKPISKIC